MKKKILYILILILTAILICACGKKRQEGRKENIYKIYYIDSSETKVVTEQYQVSAKTTDEQISELLNKLKSDPKNFSYKKTIPDSITLKDYKMSLNQQLTLNFDSNYSSLDKITEVLCRTAIVKTLCQIPGVEYVEFYVNGQPKTDSNDKPIPAMSDKDFVDNTGGEANYYQSVSLTLYFANEKGNKLVETHQTVRYNGTVSMEQLVVNQLIKGPKKPEEGYPVISKEAGLIKAVTKNNVCYLDFNAKFLEKQYNVSDKVTLYAIVNSLVELPNVNRVQFSIEGQSKRMFGEVSKFDQAFERKLDLVEKVM